MKVQGFLVLFSCVALDALVSPTNLHGQSAAIDRDAPKLVETQARKIAYLEHSGPYWTLGESVNRIAGEARSRGIRDSIFVRYPDESAAGHDLRAEVGFELNSAESISAPYKIAEWPSTWAVRKLVTGPDGLSPRHAALLKRWAKDRGLVPAGELTIRIDLAGEQHAASQRFEVFLSLGETDPQGEDHPAHEGGETTESTASDATQPSSNSTSEKVVTKAIPLDSAREFVEMLAEASKPSPFGAMSQAESQQAGSRADAGDSFKKVREPSPGLVRSWIEEKRFADVAAALLPAHDDARSNQWSDQFAARIIALANGVGLQFPGNEGWLPDLSAAIADRRSALKLRGNAPRVIGAALPVDPKQLERKALMREIDLLMAHATHRTFEPEAIREKLVELIEAAVSLTSA